MTRLNTQMINNLAEELAEFEALLTRQTGKTLLELAKSAEGQPSVACFGPPPFLYTPPDPSTCRVAVVPVTAGLGIIPGFAQSVGSILRYLGFPTIVTENKDVAGLSQAIQGGANMVFMADDASFIALNLNTGVCIDNGLATGQIFATALLEAISQQTRLTDLRGQKVAVLGLGPVGQAAVTQLIRSGVEPVVYDPDQRAVAKVAGETRLHIASSVEAALVQTPYVIDASPVPNIIGAELVTPQTIISCPGIPCGLTEWAQEKLDPERLIQHPLALGVVLMAVSCSSVHSFPLLAGQVAV